MLRFLCIGWFREGKWMTITILQGKVLYQVILADPPWKMDFSISHNRDIENHYPTMTLEEICALPIPAADDSILYLWTTTPKLNEGMIVLEKWGFRYVSNLIWDKVNFGCGWWSRVQHEILLIGVKGKMSPPEPDERCRSIISIRSDRSKDGHSRKPQEFRDIIHYRHPNLSKIELFAREHDVGWEAWGNEAPVEPRVTLF